MVSSAPPASQDNALMRRLRMNSWMPSPVMATTTRNTADRSIVHCHAVPVSLPVWRSRIALTKPSSRTVMSNANVSTSNRTDAP